MSNLMWIFGVLNKIYQRKSALFVNLAWEYTGRDGGDRAGFERALAPLPPPPPPISSNT